MNLNVSTNQKRIAFKASVPQKNENNPNMTGAMRDVSHLKQPEAPNKVKAGVLLTTALGVAAGVAFAFKRGKFETKVPAFSLKKGFFLKDTMKQNLATLIYDEKNVLAIATSSILGGLAGGAIFDKKENMKAKLREGLIQMLGNIIVPMICVSSINKLYNNHIKDSLIQKLNLKSKLAKGLPGTAVLLASLSAAVAGGFITGNLINEHLYKIRDDRKFKFADLSGHLDDTCMALSLSDDGNSMLSKTASRIIPLALLVCGFSTGTMQEWPEEVKTLRKVEPGTGKAAHHKKQNLNRI